MLRCNIPAKSLSIKDAHTFTVHSLTKPTVIESLFNTFHFSPCNTQVFETMAFYTFCDFLDEEHTGFTHMKQPVVTKKQIFWQLSARVYKGVIVKANEGSFGGD